MQYNKHNFKSKQVLTSQMMNEIDQGIADLVEHANANDGKLNLTIGTVTSGSTAAATISDGKLNLTLPKGEKGDTGPKGDAGAKGEKGDTGATASTKESLMKAAKEKLDELKLKMDYSFEISALDLRDAGVDVDRLGFMKRAQILSWPHGLNQIALCTKLSIPLEKLDEKKFTFGGASETLSSQQATGTGAAKRAVETLRSVVSYINR